MNKIVLTQRFKGTCTHTHTLIISRYRGENDGVKMNMCEKCAPQKQKPIKNATEEEEEGEKNERLKFRT